MADEKKLSLNQYLQLCAEMEHNPSEEADGKIREFLSGLVVRDYLPLSEKAIGAAASLLEIGEEFDAFGAASYLEMGKLFHGLCHYAVNLDNDIGVLARTYVGYDMCYKYGLAQTILRVASEDYARFCAYVDQVSNLSNAYRLIQTASLVSTENYDKWVELMHDLKDSLSPDLLKALEGFNIAGSGVTEDLVRKLADESVKQTEADVQRKEQLYEALAEDLAKIQTAQSIGRDVIKRGPTTSDGGANV